VLWRGKKALTLPASPLADNRIRKQGCTQAIIQRQNSGAEPLADQRVGDTLRTNTFLAIVQQQTIPAIVVAAAMYQPPGGAVLLVGHVRDHGLSSLTGNLTYR